MITSCIFDLDDTLIDTLPYYQQVQERVYRRIQRAGIDITKADETFEVIERQMIGKHLYAAHRFPLSLRNLYEALCISQDKPIDHKVGHEIEGLGWDLYNTHHKVIDGAEEVLQYLTDKGIRLICFTKGDPVVQRRKLIRSGLMGYFERVEVTPDKTPSAYLDLAYRTQVIPSETLMVGDSVYSDINPSGQAGYQPVLVPCRHGVWNAECVQPSVEHRVISRLTELKQIVM